MLACTSTLYITDKTGRESFKTLCSTQYASSERRNLQGHINAAIKNPKAYRFLDIATARIVQVDADILPVMTDDEILAELGV